MNAERLQELRSKYTSEARYRRELEIEYEALEGELLYPEFNRERNLCEPFDVSDRDRWTIYMALDPHPRTAHAMAWEAFNKHGDRAVCGEFWPEFGTTFGPTDGIRWHTREYAEWIQFFESDSKEKPEPFGWARGKRLHVRRRYMDTFGSAANSDEGEDYFETYRRLGHELTKASINNAAMAVNLDFTPALKGHDNLAKAQDSIARALMPQQDERGANIGPPHMHVFNTLLELIDEFENVRFPKPRPRPGDDFSREDLATRDSEEKVISYQKHVVDCIAEGTLITTKRGDVPIDEIIAGDSVLTRLGWRSVKVAWFVGIRPTLRIADSFGRELIGTAEHKVWTQRGWTPLVNLTRDDTLAVCHNQKLLSTMDTRSTVEGITSTLTSMFRFTDINGKRKTELSQKARSFITGMEIHSTTTSQIWNALLQRLTLGTIGVNQPSELRSLAYSAESHSWYTQRLQLAPSYVLDVAELPVDSGPGWTMRLENALSAASRLLLTATQRPRVALGNAGLRDIPRYCGLRGVYDLSVSGAHEFYANGMLVHNCLHYIETDRPKFVLPSRGPMPHDTHNVIR